jgi:hypothetical protein
MYPLDRKLLLHFDTVGLSFTKYPWAGNVYRTYATRGARTPEEARPEALYGHGPDWGYFQFGSVWYGDEIWNGGRERDYNNDGRWDQYEVQRYCDEEFGGTCNQAWTKAQHPTLGEVEVGGADPKFYSQNGPPQVLEKWARNQAMFNLAMAKSLPDVEVVSAVATRITNAKDSATHEVRVTLRNNSIIPTALEQAKRVKIVRPDIVTVTGPAGTRVRTIGRATEFHLAGKETRTITVRVQAPEGTNATVRYASTRGGVTTRELPLGR